jgi:hypothetical protein
MGGEYTRGYFGRRPRQSGSRNTMDTPVATLMELAKTHRNVQKGRDQYIFKVVTSVLTLEALFVASLLSKTYRLESLGLKLCLSAAFAGLAVVTCYHLFALHRANHTNKGIAEKAERLSVKLLQDPATKVSLELETLDYRGCHMWLWQSGIVAIGTFIATLFLLKL